MLRHWTISQLTDCDNKKTGPDIMVIFMSVVSLTNQMHGGIQTTYVANSQLIK